MLRSSLIILVLCSVALSLELRGKLPPHDDVAAVARYIVHNVDWTVISHISHQGNTTGYPHGRVYSTSDGPVGNSTGIPYFYNSDLETVARDLKIDNRCAVTMSLAQVGYCKDNNLDPESPLCAQVMMIGHFKYIPKGSAEENTAKTALFSRHPEMKMWPSSHNFQFGKFEPSNIQVLDYFGGSKFPSVPDYFNAKILPNEEKISEEEHMYNSIYRI